MPDAVIVVSFATLLQSFSPCFTAPSFESFATLMSGWVLNLREESPSKALSPDEGAARLVRRVAGGCQAS